MNSVRWSQIWLTEPVSCSNECATTESYTIKLLESSYGNIPSCSWPNHSSDVVKWSSRGKWIYQITCTENWRKYCVTVIPTCTFQQRKTSQTGTITAQFILLHRVHLSLSVASCFCVLTSSLRRPSGRRPVSEALRTVAVGPTAWRSYFIYITSTPRKDICRIQAAFLDTLDIFSSHVPFVVSK